MSAAPNAETASRTALGPVARAGGRGARRLNISFEFSPPRTPEAEDSLWRAIRRLEPLDPSFVSVTYGAGGSTRRKTVELVGQIQRDLGICSMAHLTCVGHTSDELGNILDELWTGGIRNVLALRGDPNAGQSQFSATPGGFSYANELVQFVKSRREFCIGVAGYPEGHPQCLNKTRDLEHLKRKIDAGGCFVVTQLFFDNADFYRFRDRARAMGIRVPIIAGIMPVTNVSQIKRFVTMCGAKIPHRLLTKLERIEADSEAVHRAGVEYAAMQCRDLLFNDADGLHFYTLNKSKATVEICQAIDLGRRDR
jgi:methylenetetrahydrofolate reductase (NADPH)